MSATAIKTLAEHFADWESDAFGYGYGTGEPHVIPALRRFLELCPDDGSYDYQVLERELSPTVAWLLVNVLVRVDALEYGTSPRFAWLTPQGLALKNFACSKTADELLQIVTWYDCDYVHCYPEHCNCGPEGEDGRRCPNPFWGRPC